MLRDLYRNIPKSSFYGMLSVFVLFLIIEVVLTTMIPEWRSYFFDMLKDKNIEGFWLGLYGFGALIISLGVIAGLKQFISQMLALQIRRPLSKLLLKKWIHSPKPQTKDFSQPQTESVRVSTENLVFVVRELFISGFVVIGLVAANTDQPMVILSAGIYTAVVSISAILFGKPLISSNKEWQEREGAYRESLGDIASGNGDFTSKQKFIHACKGFVRYSRISMYFTLFSSLKGGSMTLVPYIFFSSQYFSGAVSFGEFMGTVSTFELIVLNATIFTMMYPEWAKVRASYSLVNEFYINHK